MICNADIDGAMTPLDHNKGGNLVKEIITTIIDEEVNIKSSMPIIETVGYLHTAAHQVLSSCVSSQKVTQLDEHQSTEGGSDA